MITIRLDEDDRLQWVRLTGGNDQILISTAQGQGLRFEEKDVRPMGRVARGVRGIRLRAGDQVVGFDVVDDEAEVLVVNTHGYGKRTKVKLFAMHRRGGIGVKASVANTKTGPIVNVVRVGGKEDELLLISRKGQVIRLKACGIPGYGRATQGVRIMRLAKGDEIVSVALISEVKAKQ